MYKIICLMMCLGIISGCGNITSNNDVNEVIECRDSLAFSLNELKIYRKGEDYKIVIADNEKIKKELPV